MTYFFGDGFDLYATSSDAANGWWDSATNPTGAVIGAGRFTGSRAISPQGIIINKASGQNDAVHHFVLAFMTTSSPVTSGGVGAQFSLMDGTTQQCTIQFNAGNIQLRSSGSPLSGSTLATYTGAYTAPNVWYAFEFEIVVNNTTGSIAIRKNGNNVNDFFAGSLNTRNGTSNNYANAIVFQSWSDQTQWIDDFLWRSGSSVPFVGDVRCYTRMPASDASVQLTPSGSVLPCTPILGGGSNQGGSANVAKYTPFVAPCSGTISSGILNFGVNATANVKVTLFADNGSGAPGAILGSATSLANPTLGSNALSWGTPVTVTRGAQYWFGCITDTTVSGMWSGPLAGSAGAVSSVNSSSSIPYSSFPVASPTISSTGQTANVFTVNITPSGAVNAPFVNDVNGQDAAVSYVSSATVGQNDLYNIGAIGNTPTNVLAVVTRGYFEKSDAGTRNCCVQLKSGGTTVQSASTALNTVWGWLGRQDLTDPATGAAWTAVGVNNVQIGPVVTA